ncbi:F0F1 ATP synthase subunit delta [Patescibacteria group bacterium]|nr:F0F1 ATP synthase subunit delta [Patescibacteria group bacterium]
MNTLPKLKDDIKTFLSDKVRSEVKDELKKLNVNNSERENYGVVVYSAYKLGSEEIQLLKSKFRDFDLSNAKYVVNVNLLAGVVIKKGSKVYDVSLKGALANLKKIIYESD